MFGINVTRTFIEGELFFLITENLRLTRGLMARLIGAAAQEKIFKFHEELNSLGLSLREMSFLMPSVMTYSSKNLFRFSLVYYF